MASAYEFNWRTPKGYSPKSRKESNLNGHKLVIKRLYRGSQQFTLVLNGTDLLWTCPSIDNAMQRAEKHYQAFYDFNGRDRQQPRF